MGILGAAKLAAAAVEALAGGANSSGLPAELLAALGITPEALAGPLKGLQESLACAAADLKNVAGPGTKLDPWG